MNDKVFFHGWRQKSYANMDSSMQIITYAFVTALIINKRCVRIARYHFHAAVCKYMVH